MTIDLRKAPPRARGRDAARLPPAGRFAAADLAAAIKGRGTAWAIQGRFETTAREAVDDGWHQAPGATGRDRFVAGSEDDGQASPRTTVVEERARSIISRNRSPDIFFDLSINPYRGCEHGCIYCYARPHHAYLGLSPGLDFETRLFAKVNAAELLRQALSAPGYRCEPINIGSVTDAYQPIERRYRITRAILEIMAECRQPATLITKSSLIERDIDLLAPMARDGLVSACVTLTTLDAELARRMEPRAGAPWRRIETIRRLASAGIPVAVSIGPLIPFINDPEIESLLEAARAAGASSSFHTVVRLPNELAPLFRQWLDAHFPERAARVMARIQDMRGGRDNDPDFFSRMRGRGVYAELIRTRFVRASERLGFDHARPMLRVDRFRAPVRPPRPGGRAPGPQAPGGPAGAAPPVEAADGAQARGVQLSLL